MKLIDKQREWAKNYLARAGSTSHPIQIPATTTYDNGADFCEAFSEAFPGKKDDPNLTRAASRLSKLLADMWRDGEVARGRQGNDIKYVPQEPSWQYVYWLYPAENTKRRAALEQINE